MRLYEKGEKVLISETEEIGTVVERYDEPYELPEGQALGGEPSATHGGHAHYRVKDSSGDILELRDQDIRNPPKDSGEYTPYATPQQKQERAVRKAKNREATASRKSEEKESAPKKPKKR